MVQKGTILGGKYEILAHIGSGGMADVYKAFCREDDRYVAVKVLRSEYNDDENFVRKFIAEAQSTAGLHHPNLVEIYDEGHDQDVHYIVMELADGMTLKRYIRRYGRISARETVDFAIQIASAIEAAHNHGIVHRDIKPQNILVSDKGLIKVTDFGIAKAATGDTLSASTMGSVRYFSPEQARGGYTDQRSDIYSLGITIYEMATGKVPFDGDNTVAIALKHLQEEIKAPRCYFPDIPVSLENIILKCTMKRPAARYQTAGELIRDLKRVFDSPDGGYVYIESADDDCPTREQTREDLEAIRKSLRESGETFEEGTRRTPEKTTVEPESDSESEDSEDEAAIHSKFEKVILIAAVVFGILVAVFLFYGIGSALGLLYLPKGTETTTEQTTEAATEETTEAAKDMVQVPDFLKLTREKAEKRAKKHALEVKFLYEDGVDESDEELVVVSQQYERGAEVEAGTVITLTLGLSQDAKRIEVPALLNYTEDEAREELERLGLQMKVVSADSDTVPEGYVIKQNPTGGSVVDPGFTITVTISRGVKKVKVPLLYGMSQAEAETELNKVGLELGSVSSDYSGSVGAGDVIDQNPASGSSVNKGTKVSIVISLGEQETYHYEGSITVTDHPFDESSPVGKVELQLEQGRNKEILYSNDYASADSFPLDVSFEADTDDTAQVVMYVDGTVYKKYSVTWNAVAD